MTEIYQPLPPQLEVESFLKRYDKNQSKRLQAQQKDAEAAERGDRRRSRRQDDPARAERRRQKLQQSYESAMQQVHELAVPQAMLGTASFGAVAQIQKWLPEPASGAVVGLCTLGQALDTHMRALTEADLAAATVLNEVALAWIVSITQEMRERVRTQMLSDTQKVGAAYRPGLGRWPLQVQTVIFSELPTESIGVELTDSLLMLPSFSTSLVIPVLPIT